MALPVELGNCRALRELGLESNWIERLPTEVAITGCVKQFKSLALK